MRDKAKPDPLQRSRQNNSARPVRKRTSSLSINECQQIIVEFIHGSSRQELATRFNVSIATIKLTLQRKTKKSRLLVLSPDTLKLLNSRLKSIHKLKNIGQRNGSAKLTTEAVQEIKLLLTESGSQIKHTYTAIGQQFNVSAKTISMIAHGETWNWLDALVPEPVPSNAKVEIERKLYSAEEAASLLGIKYDCIYALIRAGRLKGKKPAGRWVFTNEQIAQALQNYSRRRLTKSTTNSRQGQTKACKTSAELSARTQTRRELAFELREKKFSQREIAPRLGITVSGVCRLFQRAENKQANMKIKDTPHSYASQLIDKILKDRAWTRWQLAQSLGISVRIIEKYLSDKYEPPPELIVELERIANDATDRAHVNETGIERQCTEIKRNGARCPNTAGTMLIEDGDAKRWICALHLMFMKERERRNAPNARNPRQSLMNETLKLLEFKAIYREKLQSLPLTPTEIDLLMASKALAFALNNFNLTADSPLFDPKARVDEVVSAFDKHGLTQTAYLQAIKKQPVLLNVAPRKIIDNINSVVARFHHYGLTLENYIPALVKQPPLFYLPAETVIKNISAVVEHYQSAGISLTTYIKAILFNPSLACQSPQRIFSNIETTLFNFQTDGLMLKAYIRMALRNPILFHSSPTTIISNVNTIAERFSNYGLTRKNYIKAAQLYPGLFTQQPATLINNVVAVADAFLQDGLQLKDYLSAALKQPSLWSRAPETIISKIKAIVGYYRQYGLTLPAFLHAALKQPSILLSSEETIIRNIDALIKEFSSYGITPAECLKAALRHPPLFYQSPDTIKKNISALCEHFKLEGLEMGLYIKKALGSPQLFSRSADSIAKNIETVVATFKEEGLSVRAYLKAAMISQSLFYQSPDTISSHIRLIIALYQEDIIRLPNEDEQAAHKKDNRLLFQWLIRKPMPLVWSDENLQLRRFYARILAITPSSNILNIEKSFVEARLIKFFDQSGSGAIKKMAERESDEAGFEQYANNRALRSLIRAGIIKSISLG
jgi:excisionase family DNA binding protein